MTNRLRLTAIAITTAYLGLVLVVPMHAQNPNSLLNVSYDIARELYAEINAAFSRSDKANVPHEIVVGQAGDAQAPAGRSRPIPND